MPERDGYIPGVPCWVDASEPDPEAALDFYGGLFGWEFEDVMPPSSEGRYFIARAKATSSSIFDTSGDLCRGDVAAVRSIPGAAPQAARWKHVSVGRQRRRCRVRGPRCRRRRGHRALRLSGRLSDG
jgi:uncharacterized protein